MLILLVVICGIIAVSLLFSNDEVKEEVNVVMGYSAHVKVPSSDVEVLRVTHYNSDGTIASLIVKNYKKVGLCTIGNESAIDCKFFDKFKVYRSL